MAGENLSKNYPIALKFSGYLPLYEDTSAIDLGPNRSVRLAVHGLKKGHNELDCASVYVGQYLTGCYSYVFFNNLVLAVPKMGQLSKNGTFPECKMVLGYILQSLYTLKKLGVVKLLTVSVPKRRQMS